MGRIIFIELVPPIDLEKLLQRIDGPIRTVSKIAMEAAKKIGEISLHSMIQEYQHLPDR